MPNDLPLLMAELAAIITALGALWKVLDDHDAPIELPKRTNGHLNGSASHALMNVRLDNLEANFAQMVLAQQQHGTKLDMLIEFQLQKRL